MKKQWIAMGIAAMMFCFIPVFADEDTDIWQGWNDENQENAWTVYATTDWFQMSDYLNFANEESTITANVSDHFRDELEETIRGALSDSSLSDGTYPKETYVELLLAIADQMNGLFLPENDIFHVNDYMNADIEITSREQSTKWMYNRIIICERHYNQNSSESADVYVKNNALYLITQGAIYGSVYVKEAAQNGVIYSKDTAKEYFEQHKDDFIFSNANADFAEKVLENYSTVKAIGHITNWSEE